MNGKLTMQEWPAMERPYEKLEQCGETALSDAELISILLTSGTNGNTSLEIALKLLSMVENIGFLDSASLEDMQKVNGIGRVKAIRLKAAMELGKRINNFLICQKQENLGSYHQAILHFTNKMKYLPREEFHVALLNIKNDLIRTVQVSTGDLASINIDGREIFREAIRSNAAGLILAHNHPSGDPKPSRHDLVTTQKIVAMGKELNIAVLDHVIVGSKASISLKAEGYL